MINLHTASGKPESIVLIISLVAVVVYFDLIDNGQDLISKKATINNEEQLQIKTLVINFKKIVIIISQTPFPQQFHDLIAYVPTRSAI